MSKEFDRRAMLRGSLLLVAAGTLGGCAPAMASSPASPVSLSRTPDCDLTSGRPPYRKSYGPNGTHFPDDTTWMGDTAATEIIADCNWADITRHVSALTAAQVAKGVAIRVRPGTLNGHGHNSTRTPVLSRLGDPNWQRNVLICPLEGFGSVTINNGIRIDRCTRISLYGFLSAHPFVLTECASLQIGWSRFDAMNISRGGTDLSFYELVLGFRRDPEDTAGVRPTETFPMTNIVRIGCVFGPSVKPAGSNAHCDTIQVEGTGTGEFGPFLTQDCVDYGSSNAAELLHNRLNRAEYRHCLILAAHLPWKVYPLRTGDYVGVPNAFASRCNDVRLLDCTVVGPVGNMGFTDVRGTTLSYTPQAFQQPTEAGRWIVDESTAEWTGEHIMGLQELSDYSNDSLAALWAW